jgi:hypothetical protein
MRNDKSAEKGPPPPKKQNLPKCNVKSKLPLPKGPVKGKKPTIPTCSAPAKQFKPIRGPVNKKAMKGPRGPSGPGKPKP